uniref:Uncharacterized protein n=1 Tax=Coccidioides posadasii RMSCC 3488 TaxID=454284 RepID=A0A0J6F7Q4_COCPO|nr:hypothetical protein CPAG_01676 [Coccidioides posadasii RMSCC 3488]
MESRLIPFSEAETSVKWTEIDKCNTHVHSHNWHMFQLPRSLAKEITETYIVWRARGGLSKKTLQALMAQFPKQTVYGASTESVFNSGKEWFMRLDFCSAKDGEKGAAPIHILEDIIRALCSSARARRALLDDLDDDEERKPKDLPRSIQQKYESTSGIPCVLPTANRRDFVYLAVPLDKPIWCEGPFRATENCVAYIGRSQGDPCPHHTTGSRNRRLDTGENAGGGVYF